MNIINKIKNNSKKTKVRVYLNEKINDLDVYQYVVIDEWNKIKEILEWNEITDYKVETICVNSAMELSDMKDQKVRVEAGAIIRENVRLEEQVVVLMGAIINTGCIIGKNTMIDMGCVLGANVVVKENCHIGANAVLAGVVEPYSEKNVVIEKNCFIGAGAVILEGVHIGENTTIGANAVVCHDLPNNCVAVGVPAKIIKINYHENKIEEDLRKI